MLPNLKLTNMSNLLPLEVVDRGSETQRQGRGGVKFAVAL